MDSIRQDVRFGIRSLIRRPDITLLAVLALGLGIGACTSIFTVVNSVLLRPLPFDSPDRLVTVSEPGDGQEQAATSPLNYLDWRDQSETLEYLAGHRDHQYTIITGDEPERIRGTSVSPSFFDVFGVEATRGRVFHEGESEDGAVAVLRHSFWVNRFGADPDIVGSEIVLNDRTHTIIGVMPESFAYPRRTNLWVRSYSYGVPEPPFNFGVELNEVRGLGYFETVGRLREGVTVAEADAEMRAIGERLFVEYAENTCNNSAGITPLRDILVGDVRSPLIVLAVAVGLVLLIACANIANLLLAKAVGRKREMALRGALGASRRRLLQHLLTESLILALLGGVTGLLVALWGVDLLAGFGTSVMVQLTGVTVDSTTLLFCLIASILTGIIFGLLPALTTSRFDLQSNLREGAHHFSENLRSRRLREGLVAVEVALSLMLLLGAALLLKSMVRLQQVDAGFDPEGVAVARVQLPSSRYPEEEQIRPFYDTLLERVRSLPGVEQAGLVMSLPLTGSAASLTFFVEGRPEPEPGYEPVSLYQCVSDGYFEAMRIPLLAGRSFTALDNTADAPRVVIINQAFVEEHYPDTDPIGRRLTWGDPADETGWRTIVGVVADGHHFRLDQGPEPEAFVPFAQDPWNSAAVVARTAGDPHGLLPLLRGAVQEIDPGQPVYGLMTMSERLGATLADRRFVILLLGIFAGVAALLAAVGVYGVISYTIGQRVRELGIRITLGAGRGELVGLVLGQGLKPVLWGIGSGLVLAAVLTGQLRSLLFNVSPLDAASFVGIALLVALVALLATALPTWRATTVNPTEALRQQ
jgi:putative ABC transport system permease protein